MPKLSNDNQEAFIQILSNPCSWAEAFLSNPRDPQLPLTLKSYQEEVLEASLTSKYIVLRFGRRCLPNNSPILLSNGHNKKISDIKIGDNIISYNHLLGFQNDNVTDIYDNGIQDIYNITLSNGSNIQCTVNHPLLTLEKSYTNYDLYHDVWKSIDEGLSIGDKVGVKNNLVRKNSTITSIEHIGKDNTFDITVQNNHNFISNNIISHNSGKSVIICVDSFWWTLAQPLYTMYSTGGSRQIPFRVLILTPMDAHIKMIWDTYMELIEGSQFIKDQITKIKRSDVHEIHFNNGSIIKGMTIGISTANKGLSARGQGCDYLFLDECDYIPEDVMDQAIKPITTDNPNVKIRACSTPTGKRNSFFNWCTRAKELGWWHKHVPSWHPDNTNWVSIDQAEERGIPVIESTEYQMKHTTPADAYAREYGAEFGEELAGVYKHEHINNNLINYCYKYDARDIDVFNPGFEQNRKNIFIMGVDWNTYKNGGQVVLLEYCIEPTFMEYIDASGETTKINCTGKFRIFYRRGIKSEESTQKQTRVEIINLLKKYKIDHIYVDYGAGDTNIEELTFYGREHPELMMDRKLHVIDSGSNIEHYDPILRKTVKKRAKSMMINMSVVSLEEGRILLPKEEDAPHRLIYQMRNYLVKNVTIRGDFTYIGEDHILDAFNLAIYGFHAQYSILLATQIVNHIRVMEMPRADILPVRSQSAQSPISKPTKRYMDPEKELHIKKPRIIGGYTRKSNIFGSGFRKMF